MRIFPSWCGNQIPITTLTWIRDWTTSWPNLSSDSHPSTLIREAEISPETSVSSTTVQSFTFQKRGLKIYSVKSHCFKICLLLTSALLSRLHRKTYSTYLKLTFPLDLIVTNVLWRMNYEAPHALLILLYNPLIIISAPSPQTFGIYVLDLC
jgi:hypothetical protein